MKKGVKELAIMVGVELNEEATAEEWLLEMRKKPGFSKVEI